MPETTIEQIRQRAHELWEAAGRPEGREQEFWYQAERELKTGDTPVNPDEKSDTFLEWSPAIIFTGDVDLCVRQPSW